MKICIVTAHFPPKKNAGAVRIYSFVKVWQKYDHSLTIITEKNGYEKTSGKGDSCSLLR